MGIFNTIWLYILVFIFAAVPFFEAYGVIPIGILAGLSPLPVIILGLVGNILTVLLVIVFIQKIKEWRNRKKAGEEKGPGKRAQRAQRLWKKYGLPGLAFIGPLIVGSHLTAFMSLSLGGTKRRTFYWMTASIVVWSLTFAVLIHFGIDLLGHGDRNLFN